MAEQHIIIGLGNPGKEYAKTRHNIGFMVLDHLAKKLQAEPFQTSKKFKADISTAILEDGTKVTLVKPTTFMNLSGEAATAILKYNNQPTNNIFVVYDDIDLPLGTIRLREKGSAGTHNGMKSMVQHLGQDFPRLRIGIESRGVTAPEKQPTSAFVLAAFTKEEERELPTIIEHGTKALTTALSKGMEAAMNEYSA